MTLLTLGMATNSDSSELFFMVQALHMYQDLSDCEVLVVDNHGYPELESWLTNWNRARYVKFTETKGTAQPRNKVFEEAKGKFVICMDAHVLLASDSVRKTKAWLKETDTDDLFQGPLLYDSLDIVSDHFENVWRSDMWGIWADSVPNRLRKEPYEIYMQGLGLFGAKKSTWLGFNKEFRYFGAEEGYIHEKYRQAGRTTMSLPWLQWCHYFGYGRTGSPAPPIETRIRNYLIGFEELGLSLAPIYRHFGVRLVDKVREDLKAE